MKRGPKTKLEKGFTSRRCMVCRAEFITDQDYRMCEHCRSNPRQDWSRNVASDSGGRVLATRSSY